MQQDHESELLKLLKQQMELQKKTEETLEAIKKQQQKTDQQVQMLMQNTKPKQVSFQVAPKQTEQTSTDYPPHPKGPCYICSKPGHIAKECRLNKRNKKNPGRSFSPTHQQENSKPLK